MTVFSNAKNTPELRISIGGTVRSDIDVSSRYLDIRPDKKGAWSEEITLSTPMKDLKISEVSFIPRDGNNGSGATWQSSLPIFLTFQLTKTDSVKADGYINYKLKLSMSYNEKENHYGDLIIKTNHPKKPELSIQGMVNRKAD